MKRIDLKKVVDNASNQAISHIEEQTQSLLSQEPQAVQDAVKLRAAERAADDFAFNSQILGGNAQQYLDQQIQRRTFGAWSGQQGNVQSNR